MSRATALAYPRQEILDWDDEPETPRPANTELYRLLGYGDYDNDYDGGFAYDYVAAPQARSIAIAATPYASTGAIWQAPQSGGRAITGRAWVQRLPAWPTLRRPATVLLCFAVSMLALMGAGAALHRGAPGFSLSGYRDVQVGAVQGVTVDGAPVIDATSSGPDTALAPAASAPAPVQPQSAPPSPPASAYALMGPPTISVAQIEQVLAYYGSPARGLGQTLYDLGVKHGINPAFGLAFFVHESGCGTKGVARSTKSLGNIRWTTGYDNYQGYRSYSSWAAGMEDWYSLIKDQYIAGWGLTTVDAIIPVYAPSADHNDPASYIASVKASVDSWRGK